MKIDVLAGPKASADIAKYVRLLQHPEMIEQEISPADVCKKK